jgi:hypothetical protein
MGHRGRRRGTRPREEHGSWVRWSVGIDVKLGLTAPGLVLPCPGLATLCLLKSKRDEDEGSQEAVQGEGHDQQRHRAGVRRRCWPSCRPALVGTVARWDNASQAPSPPTRSPALVGQLEPALRPFDLEVGPGIADPGSLAPDHRAVSLLVSRRRPCLWRGSPARLRAAPRVGPAGEPVGSSPSPAGAAGRGAARSAA